MLDTDTKRRIDTARDMLVGKVPDPKSQVEQITIALIYKFMDDMDAESEEFGGKRKFFAGEFARYGWAKLLHSGLGGFETLNLYAEAIAKMPENPGIPLLFRDIFKNAYLPYRDPETLRAFLKIIDEFTYDHSERLGDAFEYLLSVLGSQGDAGQFRTPRHIIDFMVAIVDPKKNETVLDPACGTAGFLISAYKHILAANRINNVNMDGQDGQDKSRKFCASSPSMSVSPSMFASSLTPDEKGRIAQNFRGYDISPDMVRLSLVNMYLHGFADPHIAEYDTLTSLDKWNEHADVILANPPFMSPTGGIIPHNRFSVQSKRSEVLFVDYMAEHLTPTGRAGIIVPEGIIFQSQSAYVQLRKMLVDNCLVAVISLPAGMFNPYSGVKTSILILDKLLAKRTDSILFLRIDNDGTDLGARRRSVSDSELPDAISIYRRWSEYCLRGSRQSQQQDGLGGQSAILVTKERIASDGAYNFTAERYRDVATAPHRKYPVVKMGEYVTESTFRVKDSPLPVWSVSNQLGFVNSEEYFHKQVASADISNYKVVAPGCFAYNPSRINVGSVALNSRSEYGAVSPMYVVFSASNDSIDKNYLFALLKSERLNRDINRLAQGAIRTQLRFKDLANLSIPLPPLLVQKEIVAEIEGYQRVINGARAVLDNYRPYIPIHSDWPMVALQQVATKITDGTHITPNYTESGVPFLRVTDITQSDTSKKYISEEQHRELIQHCHPEQGDVLYSKNGTIGVAKLVDWNWEFSIFVSLALIKPRKEVIDAHFLTCFLNSDLAYAQATARSKSGTVTNLHLVDIKTILVPLPPLSTQQAIVAEIEAEQALVAANRALITRLEKKTEATLARVWGENQPAPMEA